MIFRCDKVGKQKYMLLFYMYYCTADGGCERDVAHRMNEGYRAWGALKSVLSNRGLGIKAKKCPYEAWGTTAWGTTPYNGVVRSRGMGYEKC